MNFLRDVGRKLDTTNTKQIISSEDMSRSEKGGYGSPSGRNQFLGYFKSTPFLEAGAMGFRKQHRDVLTDDCQKYYGAVRSQNDEHNGKTIEAACEKSIVFYGELMEDGLKVRYRDDGTMDEKEMQTLHDYALQQSLEKFHATAKLGPEHIWRDCKDRIMEKCQGRFDVLNAENEERNKQAIEKAKVQSFAKYKSYVDAIVKVRREIGEMIGEQELKRVHEEAMRTAMGTYDSSSMIGGGMNGSKEVDARAIEWWN